MPAQTFELRIGESAPARYACCYSFVTEARSKAMLRIDINQGEKRAELILTGKLTGPWVAELERCWHALISAQSFNPPLPVLLDLSKVTFIDEGGKRLIVQMHRSGARLAGSGLIAGFICREIEEEARKCRPVDGNCKAD